MANKRLKSIILEVVDNQLDSNDPLATRITYERLLGLGYTGQQAKEKIGSVVATEIYGIMKSNEAFDEARYTKNLNKLK